MDGCQIVATLKYPYPITKLKKLEKKYVIAYGLIKRVKDNLNKAFLELAHDFQIQSIEDSSVDQLFNNSTIESYLFKAQAKNELPLVKIDSMPVSIENNKDEGLDIQKNPMSIKNQILSTMPEKTERLVSQPKMNLTPATDIKTAPSLVPNTMQIDSHEKKPEKKKRAIRRFFEKLFGSN